MNSNFILLSKLQRTIEYYSKLLVNFPKKEYVLKQNIEKNLYELIENLYSYNINDTDRIKQKYLKDFLIKLAMLDFYSNMSFRKKIISKRQFEVIGNFIIEARKITFSLIKGVKENEN